MELRLQVIDDKGNVVRSKELDDGLAQTETEINKLAGAVAHVSFVMAHLKDLPKQWRSRSRFGSSDEADELEKIIEAAEIKNYPFKEKTE